METDELGRCDCGTTYNVGSRTDHNPDTGECWECSGADALTMWSRPCPCCGQWEYTDESIGGEPRSMNGDRCQECGADNTTPWAVADEPHPAAWG